jgi:hypothetical protein
MVVKLGKVTRETKDQSTSSPLYDGSPFPPLLFWKLLSH